VHPVVSDVVADGRNQPRPDGVPRQGVDPMVVVDVDVAGVQKALQKDPETFLWKNHWQDKPGLKQV